MPLPASQPVVTQLTIDASGAAAGAAQYDAAMLKAEAAANKLVAANDNLQKLLDQQAGTMKQVAAANDNVARSWGGVIDGAEKVGSHLENTTANILNTVNHLKLLALGAYALSPAFRGIVNAAIPAAMKMIGEAASQMTQTILKLASPLLSFFAEITAPIAGAVLAWKGLLYVWQTGVDLLQKYKDAGRSLFSSEVDQQLQTLTKYQSDTVSAAQAQYAGQLAERLGDAKQKISDFFEVQLDVTNYALKLQAVWVNIVEIIARAVGIIQTVLDAIGRIVPFAAILGSNPLTAPLALPIQGLRAMGIGAEPSADEQMKAARARLSALMGSQNAGKDGAALGSTFAARFSQDLNALSNIDNSKDKNSTNAYDRALQGIKDQIDLLKLEADGAGKTTQQYQELKIAHELNLAAMKAGIKPTDEMRDEWKKLADQVADYTIKARAAAALQSEQFKGATMFMSPAEQAAANVAHQIDPADWQSHMHDLAAETARFNTEMGQARDTAVNFLSSFNNDIINGTVSMNTLANATKGLANTLLQMAEKNLVNAVLGPLMGGGPGGGGGFNFLKLFGFQDGGSFVVPAGAGAMALPGFADGTDFTVPGSGAPDSKVTAFRVSPGERVTVTPPGKSTGGGATIVMGGNTYNFPTNADPAFRAQIKQYVDQSHRNAVAEAVTAFARVYGNTPRLLQGK